MGLPKSFQAVELSKINETDPDGTQFQRAQLWESICSADRLFGTIINLPCGTRRYHLPTTSELTIDGVVQTRTYLSRLAEITIRVQDLDDVNATQRSNSELYASSVKIDRDLKELVSQTPRSWWAEEVGPVKADHILRFLHSCITMRTHLPLTMRQNSGEEYTHSRLACMNACQLVVNRYQLLRPRFPSGIFLAQIMDLQAFTASVVLLLTSHSSISKERLNLRTNEAQVKDQVEEVIKLMNEKSCHITSSSFARHGATTLRSLQTLLREEDNNFHVQEMNLKVPLLGNVRIRRNKSPSQSSNIGSTESLHSQPESALWNSDGHINPQQYMPPTLVTNGVVESTIQPPRDGQWDPLSWSVDNYNENFFQDAFLTATYDQLDMWQNSFNDI